MFIYVNLRLLAQLLMRPTIKKFEIRSLAPTVTDPAVKALLPKTLPSPDHVRVTIAGVNNAIANAIRRVICLELPVLAMICEYTDIETDDPHVIPEMIIKRLRLIPVNQSCPPHMKFSLHAQALNEVLDVKSGSILPASGKPMFNETFTLLSLQPERKIFIKNITVQTLAGNTPGNGMHALASGVAIEAIDKTPEDGSSSVVDPSVYCISFTTNGTMEPKKIVEAACKNIIARLQNVSSLLHTITSSGNEYHLQIPDETDTIGNLFMRDLSSHYTITYTCRGGCKIRIQSDDIDGVFAASIKRLVGVFNQIISDI